jgi:PAS domain-containing protein
VKAECPDGKSLVERYEALIRVSHAIGVYRDPKELFRVLADELRHAVDFDFLGLFFYDETSNTFENPVLETIHGPGIFIPPDFPPEQTITWWIYHHQQPVVISSREEEPRFPQMMKVFAEYGVESACLLPLTTAHRRLGSIAFGMGRRRFYPEEEVRYLSLVADQVALAVDNALREREQKRGEAYLAEGQRLSHTGSWARNVSTGEVYFSEESLRIFGFDPKKTKLTLEEVLGRVHPKDRPRLEHMIHNSIGMASDFETGYRIILDDGSIRLLRVLGHPVRNSEGQLVEFVGTHMDVTEQTLSRKALENALRNQGIEGSVVSGECGAAAGD